MATVEKASKSSRLVSRAAPEVIELVQDAADIMGTSVSDFLREIAIERAREVVTKHEKFELSVKGQAQIMDAIMNPPQVHAELLNIAKEMEENDGIFIRL
jgi:uncharacterized protein (DUF1778 family)